MRSFILPDYQRSRVYRAEDELKGHRKRHEANTFFDSGDEAEAYANKAVRSAWFQERWPHVKSTRVVVPDKEDRRTATGCKYGSEAVLVLPRWSWQVFVVLHELAHSVTMDALTAHGGQFCHVLLQLVRKHMGQEAHDHLTARFLERGVNFGVDDDLDEQDKWHKNEEARNRQKLAGTYRSPWQRLMVRAHKAGLVIERHTCGVRRDGKRSWDYKVKRQPGVVLAYDYYNELLEDVEEHKAGWFWLDSFDRVRNMIRREERARKEATLEVKAAASTNKES